MMIESFCRVCWAIGPLQSECDDMDTKWCIKMNTIIITKYGCYGIHNFGIYNFNEPLKEL